MIHRPRGGRGAFAARRGIALVVTLVVVLLITTLLSQFNFTTTLELRSLQNQKEGMQARALARSAFKSVQSSLLQDESDFLVGYQQLKSAIAFSAIPWEEGLLLELEVEPLDRLFNINRIATKPGSEKDDLQHLLFQNTLKDVIPEPDPATGSSGPIESARISAIYAALFDWIDKDEVLYRGSTGEIGAESADYLGAQPERVPPNRELDRLTEIRLVRGVAESRIAWKHWRERFTIYEPEAAEANVYPGLLNVNGASQEQIVAFLEARRVDDAVANELGPDLKDKQLAINDYADNAEAIALELAPPSLVSPAPPRRWTVPDVTQILKHAGVDISRSHQNQNQWKQVFSISDDLFRVRIVTLVGATRAELEAVLYTERDKNDRTAGAAEILEYTLR